MFSAATQKIAKRSFVCVFFGSYQMSLVEDSNILLMICSSVLISQDQTHIWNSNFHLLLANSDFSVKYLT